ncbi:hypothetical protein BC941DRAFT_438637 [Chlamydoabsidia padenii]|nr:hypothetical protein BC941DRAFT_438637 [Chlamydoabsidia padenii]
MKKLFGGRKKKGPKATSFLKADPEQVKTQVLSRKPHPEQNLMNGNNIDTDRMYRCSQGSLETALPKQQATLTKRLQRPTSSPLPLVMPCPRYAEPPTGAILRSYEHDKTQLDPEHIYRSPMEKLIDDLMLLGLDPTQSSISNEKPADDDTGIFESMNSVASNSDSDQVYKSAMTSPSVSNVFNCHGMITPVQSTPTNQLNQDHHIDMVSSAMHDYDMTPNQEQEPDQLHVLQQKLLLLQEQSEMDRIEYGQLELALMERTRWMDAEMDRTQNKIMALSDSSKRGSVSSQLYYDPHHYIGDDSVLAQSPILYESAHLVNQYSSAPLRKSKSGDSLPCLSRSSSRTSIGTTRKGTPVNTSRPQLRSYSRWEEEEEGRVGYHSNAWPDGGTRTHWQQSRPMYQHWHGDRPSSRSSRHHHRSRSVERPHSFYYHRYSPPYEDEYIDNTIDYLPDRRPYAVRLYPRHPNPSRQHQVRSDWVRPHSRLVSSANRYPSCGRRSVSSEYNM